MVPFPGDHRDVALLLPLQRSDKCKGPLPLRRVRLLKVQLPLSWHPCDAEQSLASIGSDREPGYWGSNRDVVPVLRLDS